MSAKWNRIFVVVLVVILVLWAFALGGGFKQREFLAREKGPSVLDSARLVNGGLVREWEIPPHHLDHVVKPLATFNWRLGEKVLVAGGYTSRSETCTGNLVGDPCRNLEGVEIRRLDGTVAFVTGGDKVLKARYSSSDQPANPQYFAFNSGVYTVKDFAAGDNGSVLMLE